MKKFIMIATLGLAFALAGTASAAQFVYQGGLIKVGSHGTQVMNLQECLARLGNNPESNIDGSFGPITKGAVMAFQAENGVVVDGIIGPVTGPLYTNACAGGSSDVTLPAGCTSTEGYSTETGEKCDSGTSTIGDLPAGCTAVDTPMYSPSNGQRCVLGEGGSDTGYEGTEGSVDSYSLGSSEDTEALEGESDIEIYAADVKLDALGDLALNRLDVWFSNSNAAATLKPWKYFKSVSVLVDGEEVATLSADSSSDWSDYSDGEISAGSTTQEYRMRFSGLDKVFKSDETTKVSIAVTMQNVIDSADQVAVWNVEIDDDAGFRWVDGTGFIFTEGAGGATLEDSFTVGSEKLASLLISSSDNDPKGRVIEVDDTNDTNGVLVGSFNIEEKNGVDVNIDEMQVTLASSGTVADIVKKAYLFIGGNEVDSESVTSGTVTFDNLNYDLGADETKEVSVKLDIDDTNSGVRYAEGVTMQVSGVNLTRYEDANGNDEGDFTESGSYTGNTNELRSEGITVDVKSATTNVHQEDGTGNDTVDFTWEIDISTLGDKDVYVNRNVANVVATATSADDDVEIGYSVEISGGAALVVSGGTITESDSDVDQATGDDTAYGTVYNGEEFFKIRNGSTGTFTINLSATNATQAKQARAYLDVIEWTTDLVEDATSSDALADTVNDYIFDLPEDSQTPYVTIN